MISFKVDSSGDLDISKSTGSVNIVSGNDYIAQKIRLLLGTNAGELPWNPSLGFHQANFIASANNQSAISTMINDYLRQNLDGFKNFEITDYQVIKGNREARITGDVSMLNDNVASVTFGIGGDY